MNGEVHAAASGVEWLTGNWLRVISVAQYTSFSFRADDFRPSPEKRNQTAGAGVASLAGSCGQYHRLLKLSFITCKWKPLYLFMFWGMQNLFVCICFYFVLGVSGMSMPDFDNQTLAALRGRMVRYLMRSREVSNLSIIETRTKEKRCLRKMFVRKCQVTVKENLFFLLEYDTIFFLTRIHTDYIRQSNQGQTDRCRSVARGACLENLKKTRWLSISLNNTMSFHHLLSFFPKSSHAHTSLLVPSFGFWPNACIKKAWQV